MYSKGEASKIREQFWITFGKYMKPIPSAEGLPINWVNYKTGVKNVSFKMDAGQRETKISIDITHHEVAARNLFFEQFKAFKSLFTHAISEEWEWSQNIKNEYGIPLAQISTTKNGISVFNQEQWPTIISFLKPRVIALDQFWVDVKPVFEDLG